MKMTSMTSHFFNFAERILQVDMLMTCTIVPFQFLRSESLPNLRKFVLHGYHCEGQLILPPLEELLNLFGDFSPTVLQQEIWQYCFDLTLGEIGHYGQLEINSHSANIFYYSSGG